MYTPEQVEAVCEDIEASAIGTQKALLAKGMNTKEFWATLDADDSLRKRYTRAKEIQAENLAEEIVAISDGIEGGEKDVNRDRLRVESRKWVAAKLLPKKYGDRMDVTSGNEPIKQTYIVLPAEVNERL